MHLDKNSYGTVTLVCVAAVLAGLLALILVDIWWINLVIIVFLIWLCRWQIMFHMVPDRISAAGQGIVTAVADGRIVYVEKMMEDEWLHRECMLVSIYMDFWDYHANFWPISGVVAYTKYHPGKHFLAFKPKASEENEHTCTSIRTSSGSEVFFKQLAGGFARRIVCYARPEMKVNGCDQCGIIKFGSRIDIYLPLSAEIRVKCGDVVRACETVIAKID